jgi:hypothetical protein
MFDDEIKKEKKPKKEPKEPAKVGRFATSYGRMPVSATYGSEFPTCWLHAYQCQMTHTS